MGQYYKAINITDKLSMNPFSYGQSNKLTVHSFIWNPVINTFIIENLLNKVSEITWAWDYSDFYKNFDINTFQEFKWNVTTKKDPIKVIFNLDREEYVTIPKYVKDTDVYHPLPLLTCEWNGLWGWDYYEENDYIGAWNRQRLIAFSTMKDFNSFIKENWFTDVVEIFPNF